MLTMSCSFPLVREMATISLKNNSGPVWEACFERLDGHPHGVEWHAGKFF